MTRNQYKALAERRADTIRQLTQQLEEQRASQRQLAKQLDTVRRRQKRTSKQLTAELRLCNAMSKLTFLPKGQQDPERLKQVRRATTMKRNVVEGRAA